jgi:hypothetical protein
MPYATIADIYAKALRAESFVSRARVVASADPIANVLNLPGHGFVAGLLPALTFLPIGAPTPGAFAMAGAPAIPSGLSPSTLYYPQPIGSDLFQVATTPTGSPVALVDAGTPLFGIRIDVATTLGLLLVSQASVIDEVLTNYDPPILPDPVTGLYPEILVTTNARLVAQASFTVFGMAHPQYETSLAAQLAGWQEDVKAAMDRWFAGRAINVHPQDQTSGVLEGAARFGRGRRSRGMDTRVLR